MKNKKSKLKHSNIKIAAVAIVAMAGIFLYGNKLQQRISGEFMTKGNFYFNGGAYDLEKAVKFYKIAAFVDKRASYPHYQLARVLFVKVDYDNARAEIDKALALNPNNTRAYYIRGLINGHDEKFEAAAADFKKFIESNSKEWAGYNDLAWAYYENKDYQSAVDAAQGGLRVVSGNAWLLNGLGVSLQALGKDDEAKIALDQAAEAAKNMSPADWKKAYPGNDAKTAEWDLAQFRTDVKSNLQLTTNPFSSGKGKFQAACSSSTLKNCNTSNQCVTIECDPDCNTPGHIHNCSGCYWSMFASEGQCSPVIPSTNMGCTLYSPRPCSTDQDCCADTSWTPTCGTPNCTYWGGFGILIQLPGVTQTSNCGRTRCVSLPACPANNAPTGSIQHPKNEQVSPGVVVFSWNYSDPDGDTQDGYEITGSCSSSGAHNSTVSSGYSSSSVTLGGFVDGDSCNWTLRVKDNKGGWSNPDSAAFTVASAPSLPSCACGDLESLCIGRLPTSAEMCDKGTPNPSPGNLNLEDYEVTWSCDPDVSCSSSASCSAQGRKSCGWIETNP